MNPVPVSRKVLFEEKEIYYQLEQKPVKNLNLRIKKDGSVFVSANERVPISDVDEFVVDKGAYILASVQHFQDLIKYQPQPKLYISGETFNIQGRGLRLNVTEGEKDEIHADGVYIYLQTKNPADTNRKERIVTRYLDAQSKELFTEIMTEIYPLFQKYGVEQPSLRIHNMDTRWGSCLPQKGIITLNKRLLEAPRNCIEYVVMHEFCHLVYPNHSKQFTHFWLC